MCAKQRIRTRTRGVHHGTKPGLMSWGGEFGEVLGVLRAALGAARLEALPEAALPMEGDADECPDREMLLDECPDREVAVHGTPRHQ